jgi:hypothetical protein
MSVERARADLEGLEQTANQLRGKLAEAEAQATKIRIYIEMASVYDVPTGGPPSRSPAKPEASPANGGVTLRKKGGRPRPEGGGIVERAQKGAAALLNAAAHPIMTRELLRLLVEQGMQIGGNSPSSNLSGMLSRSDLFKSGKDGWTLAAWDSTAATSVDTAAAGNAGHSSAVDLE